MKRGPVENLVSLLKAKRRGKGWEAKCPAHEDRKPSLSINEGADGRALIKCHAGCSTDAVLRAIDLTTKDLFPSAQSRNGSHPVATYDYTDETGRLLYQVCRLKPKDFRQRRRDWKGRWTWNLNGVRRVLYRLPEVIKAQTVCVTEGEKDADNLAKIGITATCNSGGAGKWRDDYSESLRGKDVVIFGDDDEPGRAHVKQLIDSLNGVARSIKHVPLPVHDVSDHIATLPAKAAAQSIAELIEATPVVASEDEVVDDFPEPLTALAFQGLAGDIVRRIEPHTGADSAALLIQVIVAFGNVIGRDAFCVADGSRHAMNTFAVLVGESSKARKGTSWRHVLRIFERVDEQWKADCVTNGLSSGEGLIWDVRDPITRTFKNKKTGEEEREITDCGINDKRLCVVEGEFANVLKVMTREGNTLSPVIRSAWDSGTLRSMTKNSPARATDAHISIIGHITKDELRRLLTETESANGFGNRFLWLAVRRSKCLPEGGNIGSENLNDLVKRLHEAIEFARSASEVIRSESAREMWRIIYPELSEGKPGLLGAITARAEAQVLRLSAIFAYWLAQPRSKMNISALRWRCGVTATAAQGGFSQRPPATAALTEFCPLCES